MPSVLILAGGTGERFWPASTVIKPKQFLPLTGSLPIIRETVDRVQGLVGLPKIFVVTTRAQFPLVCQVLPELPPENIIVEPEGRNTAPSLVLSAAYIKKKFGKNEVAAVLPADHFIGDTEAFQDCLQQAFRAAEGRKRIITFGIRPDRPETDYGYIAIGNEVSPGVYSGVKFVEKPNLSTARRYLEQGGYLWNSGMFIFRIAVFLESLKRYAPELYKGYQRIEQARDSAAIEDYYKRLPRVSIDYALMERLSSFLVIPGRYSWDDLGTWRSLDTSYPRDVNGNVVVGDGILTDVYDCVVYSPDKLVGAIGVKDLVIAVGREGILICPKERVRDVRQIVEDIKKVKSGGSVDSYA